MNTCKNCAHWYHGECVRVEVNYSRKIDALESNDARIDVLFSDDHGLDVTLRTGPDFGCTNFQSKTS